MKKAFILLCTIAVFTACNNTSQQQQANESNNTNTVIDMNIKDKSFEELFTKVDNSEIRKTLSKLMSKEDHTVITAGTDEHYNSMAASWEALGHYFEKPTTLCLLGAGRYTLEFIKEQQTYTMSFFPGQFKGDVMAFGTKSGRNSDMMKETKLTHVLTPSGNSTYKEANVVIECRLFEITTVNPTDFYDEDGKKFVEDALKEANDYHKLVFGTVTNIWVRK